MSIHISAAPGEIEKVVLLPGDPLRAKYMAENYLSKYKLVSSTRNIYFYYLLQTQVIPLQNDKKHHLNGSHRF